MEAKKFGIRTKIITIMLIVIIFPIAVISLISYKSSSNMMTDQYRELGMTIGNEITSGIDIKMNDMENALANISASNQFVFGDTDDEVDTELEVDPSGYLRKDLSNLIDTYKVNSSYFIGEDGSVILEGEGLTLDNLDLEGNWYTRATEDSNKDKVIWSNIKEDESGNWYVIMSKGVYSDENLLGVVASDVPVEVFDNILSEKRIGSGGFPILLDGNGVKLALKDTEEIGIEFKGKENFENMDGDSKAVRNSYTNPEGVVQDQFTIINKVNDSGWKLVTIVPINNIKESTSSMLRLILIVGFITMIVGIMVAILFSKSIIKPLNNLVASMRRMENGDFTEEVSINNKDEFGDLRDGCNNMMGTLSLLIDNIKDISNEVSISSETLAAVSEETSASGEEISKTAEDIARGASNQVDETNHSSGLIRNLSTKLAELGENSRMILDSVLNVDKTIESSNHIVVNLSKIAKENSEKTEDVSRKIYTLDEKIGEIGGILATIDQIAEQTNLLALNAGIEAARAGEYGTGFAVVAEEIRKLAGESKESSSDIKTIIEDVQIESKETVAVMNTVVDTNDEQENIVARVDESFDNLSNVIENINSKINEIGSYIEDINNDKDDVVSSIDNILSVSEQTAAASEQVSASIDQQSNATVDVAEAAEKLNELSHKLNEEMSKFRS